MTEEHKPNNPEEITRLKSVCENPCLYPDSYVRLARCLYQ